jgi:hypothetical protein
VLVDAAGLGDVDGRSGAGGVRMVVRQHFGDAAEERLRTASAGPPPATQMEAMT